MEEKIDPKNGGCWFCCTIGDKADMKFDREFDTNVHLTCIRDNLGKGNEAEAMQYLLED